MAFYTYIMACRSNTAIYIGVTGNLPQRAMQHRSGAGSTHTAKYRITKLVWFETHEDLSEAIARERKLKRWRRAWKNALIAETNPNWSDLSMEASFT
ncbi:MAG: GIY-YIG nuclease family protein [Rhodobacteraceae bacterium]|nr:GIY-YIG nuclease family protein [Paracoccaceae bacterium]